MADSATDALKSKKQLLLNLLTAVLLLVTVAACFNKTVFAGVPISRVYQLGQRDTLFSKYFTPNREGYDASVYQYFVPSHFFLTKQLRQGVIPFWNPLVGCGAPFLADVETAVFWPFRLLLLWLPPLEAWNLLIVANVINFAIGTFLLGKALQLRRFAIIFSSLSCAFCPYLIFQSELIGSSASMIPLVMASFVNAHTRKTLLSRFLAGMACAVMILSGHPEPSFFGIACASLLYICLELFSTDSPDKTPKRLLISLLNISIIGIVAFSFCAFMLLPFLELLKHSDCYKLGLTGHRPGVPLNSILINLIHPAYGNSSPYLGILCVPLALTAIFFGLQKDKIVRALTLSILISIAAMSQLGPLDLLMNSKAFSWFVPKYCWPSLLVMLSVLTGCGFQSLASEVIKNWRKTSACTIICALLTIVSLAALRVSPGLLDCIRQDEAFEQMQIFSKFFTRDIILLAVFCVAVVLSRFLGKAQAAACV
ncbi:MAG: hypothetical protein K2X81_06940, partial [Candidatus Obscuribacterales bacterium]|nr:hypothetical protein [Candidatus Obscuribacterales bacterium]